MLLTELCVHWVSQALDCLCVQLCDERFAHFRTAAVTSAVFLRPSFYCRGQSRIQQRAAATRKASPRKVTRLALDRGFPSTRAYQFLASCPRISTAYWSALSPVSKWTTCSGSLTIAWTPAASKRSLVECDDCSVCARARSFPPSNAIQYWLATTFN